MIKIQPPMKLEDREENSRGLVEARLNIKFDSLK